jgi:hypothetical protein
MIVIRNKKKKLVWILVWAGLFIAVLYSPIGSPDLYTSKYYYAEYQSVTFKDGTIPNASKIKSSQEYNDDAPELPDISESLHANYAAGNYSSAPVSTSQGSYYGGGQLSYQNNNSSGSGSGGGSFVVSGRSGSSAASSGFSMTSGITTLSLTTNLNASTSKQSVTNYTTDTGGTDPGGDPGGNPIPVGDGWGLLVLLGLCYVAYKMVLINKNQLNPHSGKTE